MHHELQNSAADSATGEAYRDLDVPRYYVWTPSCNHRSGELDYWVLDSTRDDSVVQGPADLESALALAADLNANSAGERP
jgi:hypothetical protein